MDLFDLFPCYLHHIASDRLKSHIPFPCPESQLIYIFLKFQRVFCILNFLVANTVICKVSYFRINNQISLMYKGNNKRPRTVPCGTPNKTRAQPDFAPFTTTYCRLQHKWNLAVSTTYLIPPAIWNANRYTEVNNCKVLKWSNGSSRRSWFHTLCSIKPLFSWSHCPSWLC